MEDGNKTIAKLNFYLVFVLAIENVVPLPLEESCGEIEGGEHTNV